jgi:hypothetical protein
MPVVVQRCARWIPAGALYAFLAAACGSNSPSGPSSTSYRGEWAGTTSQGSPISFSISPDEKVTSITVGYNFNGCSGSQTFSNLSLDIAPNVMCIPGPCSADVLSYRAFGFATGSLQGPSTSVTGLFPSLTTAQGVAGFREYPGCGTASSVPWTAIRR